MHLVPTIEEMTKEKEKAAAQSLGQVGLAQSVICSLSIHPLPHKCPTSPSTATHCAKCMMPLKESSIFSTFLKTSAITTCIANLLS